jgi:hypothetical protein
LTVKSVDRFGENNNYIYAFVTIAINSKYLLHIEHVLHSVHRWRRIKIKKVDLLIVGGMNVLVAQLDIN